MSKIRRETQAIARKHQLPIADVLELYDGFVMDGMSEMDAAVKALAITSVVNGDGACLLDDPEAN